MELTMSAARKLEPMYTTAEAKRFLGLSRIDDVRHLVRDGRLRGFYRQAVRGRNIMRRLVIPESALLEYQRGMTPVGADTQKMIEEPPPEKKRKRRQRHLDPDELLRNVDQVV
jgi:hypothetical protein